MSKLYLRDTTGNTAGYAATEKSSVLPVGTANPSGNAAQDLSTTAGASAVSATLTSLAQTAHQDGFIRKWISATLAVSEITAQTWTLAFNFTESNGNANAFLVASIYVLKSDDTVRGYVYDSDTAIGTEWALAATGEVNTISGAAVSGVVSTDRLVVEVWAHATQAMAVAYTLTLRYNGATDPVDGVGSNDPACYIETPQNLFAGGTNFQQSVGGSITPAGALIRKAKLTRAGSSTATGALARKTKKTLTGSATGSGALTKKSKKTLTGSLTGSGTVAAVRKFIRNLTGSSTPTGTLQRKTGKRLAGAVTGTGSVTTRIRKTLTGSSTGSGVLTVARRFARNLAGSASATGALTRQTRKRLVGTASPAGALSRRPRKTLTGSSIAGGTLARRIRKTLSGSVLATGTVNVVKIVGSAIQGIARTVARVARRGNVQSPRTGRSIPGGDPTREV